MFDLDDTLYAEHDFVCSGFKAVANYIKQQTGVDTYDRLKLLFQAGVRDVFELVIDEYKLGVDKKSLLEVYRFHSPELRLQPDVESLLDKLLRQGHVLGVLTDGRSITQRNKIRELGLEHWIAEFAISEELGAEKPSPVGYQHLQQRFAGRTMAYVGDNPAKDFLAPNQLGWLTVCVRAQPANIHPQDFDRLSLEYWPLYLVDNLA